MFERSELALKIFCVAVVGLVVYRLGLVIVHINPLAHVTIPVLPSLPSPSPAVAAATGTNSPQASAKPGTNVGHEASVRKGTNVIAQAANSIGRGTNALAYSSNAVARGSNSVAQSTNAIAHATNSLAQATNSSPGQISGQTGPNSLRPQELARMGMPPGAFPGMPPGALPGMPPGGFPGMPKPGPPLPPEVQARLDRIIDSEILAPVMRPLPMALLGIAGKDVFLRAPNGQTGLVKEGEDLAGIKLLRIGINRVLVEEQGEKKELTIFAGLGSESLLSNQKDNPK